MLLKKAIICILSVLIILMTGCAVEKESDESEKNPSRDTNGVQAIDYCEDIKVSDGEKIVYNIYAQKLGIFNEKENNWKALHDNDNEFAYKSNEANDIFTIGNSSYNFFSIMEKDSQGLKKIIDINEQDSAMPFGEYTGEYFFLYNVDDLSEKIERKIVKLNKDDNRLVDVFNLDNQLVTSAVIIKDNIYYVSYKAEKDLYELYQYNLKNGSSKLILKDLPTDYIYDLDGALIWNDGKGNIRNFKGKLYSLGKQKSVIDYNSEYKLFFQIYRDESNELKCDIWNAETGKMVKTVEQFIGYDVENETLLLYGNSGVQKVSLEL